jgi:hypothetical protein
VDAEVAEDAATDLGPSDLSDLGGPDGDPGPCPVVSPTGFDDHTVPAFDASRCLFDYAGPFESDPVALKFVIADFHGAPALRFYDNAFYRLHDEWYWFRLLNGAAIPGLAEPAPLSGLAFASVADIYAHYAGTADLPLDLAFIAAGPMSGRLYSAAFYRLGGINAEGGTRRFFGLGTLLHFAPNPARKVPEEIWAFELEYADRADVSEIERFFSLLEAGLPEALRGKLRWVTRSGAQNAVATAMKTSGHRLASRTLRYADLVVEGAVEVYNAGIAAGRVHVLEPDFSPSSVRETDLAVLPTVPDDIPPSRAILSDVPQTALAHVNLLAKSRGTPNAHVAGLLEWPQLGDWDYLGQPLIVSVTEDAGQGKVRWQPISVDQLATYETLLAPPERHVQTVDVATIPLTVELDTGGAAAMSDLVPLAGGKAAGFLSLAELGMRTPDHPIALTIKSFREHMADLDPLIEAVLELPDMADSRVRLLVLEGEPHYREVHADDPAALAFLAQRLASHANDPLAEVIARGGVKAMVVDKPIAYDTLRAIRERLVARFADLAPTQALRFRSSSTAEDVPGFNGAGLYVSHTGYLFPSQLGPSDRDRTVERAIKDTWASYWGFQAFEERRAAHIDHFEGAMAVVIHPRFDDDRELANAVATFWWSDYGVDAPRRLVLNVQAGALLVTNPGGTTERPEIDELLAEPGAEPVIMRRQASTLSPDKPLLSDEMLRQIYTEAEAHTGRWLEVLAARLPASERPKTLVLDYELKLMAEGWPSLVTSEVRPAGIVWKQARVLDQVARIGAISDPIPNTPLALSATLPTDLRTVTRQLEVDRCLGPHGELRVYHVLTEPGAADLFPFSERPFVYRAWVDLSAALDSAPQDTRAFYVPWTGLAQGLVVGGSSSLRFDAATATALGFDGFELTPPAGSPQATYRIYRGAAEWRGTCTQWAARVPYRSAPEYLRSLLP